MTIPFTCPHCRRHTEVAEQYAGRSGPCAGCGQTITVPSPQVELAAPLATRSSNTLTVALIVVAVLFGLLLCGGVGVGLLMPALMVTRNAARNVACGNNLTSIGAALRAYEMQYGRLPPPYVADSKGRPTLSWRVLLLPFLEKQDLYRRFHLDEPWDSPHNRALAEEMPAEYRCPVRPGAERTFTTFMLVVGERTAFRGPVGTPLADIDDPLARTLLVVEAGGPGVCWTRPIDLSLSTLDYPSGRSRNERARPTVSHPSGLLFADGVVHRFRKGANENLVRQAATCDDGLPDTLAELTGN